MLDDDFDELLELVEREEAERNRELGLDFMDVVGAMYFTKHLRPRIWRSA